MTTKTEKIQKLWTLYESVQSTLDEYQDNLDDLRKSRAVTINDALEFSERIAPSAFAPLGWTEGLPLLNAFPPAPQADQMRLGRLSEYNRRIDLEVVAAPSSSSKANNPNQSVAMKAAMEKVKSLKERLQAKKEEDARKEEQMEVEPVPHIEEVSVKEESLAPETIEQQPPSFEYLSTNTRRTSLTFAPAEDSESEEEDDD
eukprot:gene14991-16694_t